MTMLPRRSFNLPTISVSDRTAVLLATASLLTAPGLASAQSAEGAQTGIADIIVTAERREVSIQKTPVTVSALSADQIERLGITSTQDIAKSVPNLQLLPLTANPSTFQVGLRGGVEQTGGLIVSEPVVGLYVDDVYRGRLQGANFQLPDVERIEVLRGPQGTLYGRNNFSGAMKIVTRRPSADNEWADASVGYGSFEEFNIKASAGLAVTDSIAMSISGLYRNQSDGYIFNRAQGKDLGAERNILLRGKFIYEEGPWTADLSVSWGRDDNDGYIPLAVRFDPFTVPTNFATQITTDQVKPRFGTDPYITEYPQESIGETETFSATLALAYDFDAFTLKSITGYVDMTDVFRWDIAAGQNPSPGVYTASFDRRSDASASQFTQEIQALGKAFDNRLDWIVGGFLFDESGDQTLKDDIPLFFLFDLDPTNLAIKTTSWAIFGQATYAITDQISIVAGGRYTEDDKSFDADLQSGFGAPNPRTFVSLDEKFTAFTPKIGVNMQITEDMFAYASASRGFKGGGFNGLSVLNPFVLQAVYGPQKVWAYEAGVKADWLDSRLRTNIALFWNDISELQQTAQIGAGSFAQQNVGDATVKGVEFEVIAQPIDGLNLFANIGYMDGEYDRLDPASQAATAGGRFLPLVTDWTAQYGFNYQTPVAERFRVEFGATGNYVGDHYLEVTNAVQVKGYSRFDAFAAIGDIDKLWTLKVEVKNLTDEINYVTGFASSPNPALAALRPRQWMASMNFRF